MPGVPEVNLEEAETTHNPGINALHGGLEYRLHTVVHKFKQVSKIGSYSIDYLISAKLHALSFAIEFHDECVKNNPNAWRDALVKTGVVFAIERTEIIYPPLWLTLKACEILEGSATQSLAISQKTEEILHSMQIEAHKNGASGFYLLGLSEEISDLRSGRVIPQLVEWIGKGSLHVKEIISEKVINFCIKLAKLPEVRNTHQVYGPKQAIVVQQKVQSPWALQNSQFANYTAQTPHSDQFLWGMLSKPTDTPIVPPFHSGTDPNFTCSGVSNSNGRVQAECSLPLNSVKSDNCGPTPIPQLKGIGDITLDIRAIAGRVYIGVMSLNNNSGMNIGFGVEFSGTSEFVSEFVNRCMGTTLMQRKLTLHGEKYDCKIESKGPYKCKLTLSKNGTDIKHTEKFELKKFAFGHPKNQDGIEKAFYKAYKPFFKQSIEEFKYNLQVVLDANQLIQAKQLSNNFAERHKEVSGIKQTCDTIISNIDDRIICEEVASIASEQNFLAANQACSKIKNTELQQKVRMILAEQECLKNDNDMSTLDNRENYHDILIASDAESEKVLLHVHQDIKKQLLAKVDIHNELIRAKLSYLTKMTPEKQADQKRIIYGLLDQAHNGKIAAEEQEPRRQLFYLSVGRLFVDVIIDLTTNKTITGVCFDERQGYKDTILASANVVTSSLLVGEGWLARAMADNRGSHDISTYIAKFFSADNPIMAQQLLDIANQHSVASPLTPNLVGQLQFYSLFANGVLSLANLGLTWQIEYLINQRSLINNSALYQKEIQASNNRLRQRLNIATSLLNSAQSAVYIFKQPMNFSMGAYATSCVLSLLAKISFMEKINNGKKMVTVNPVRVFAGNFFNELNASLVYRYLVVHGDTINTLANMAMFRVGGINTVSVFLATSAPNLLLCSSGLITLDLLWNASKTFPAVLAERELHNIIVRINALIEANNAENRHSPQSKTELGLLYRDLKNTHKSLITLISLARPTSERQQQLVKNHKQKFIEFWFHEKVALNELEQREVPADGNCLFHALAYYTDVDAGKLRQLAFEYEEQHRSEFENFFTEGAMSAHLMHMRGPADVTRPETWGGEHEIRALEKVLRRPIIIIQPDGKLSMQSIETMGVDELSTPIFVQFYPFNPASDVGHYGAILMRCEDYFEEQYTKVLDRKRAANDRQLLELQANETRHSTPGEALTQSQEESATATWQNETRLYNEAQEQAQEATRQYQEESTRYERAKQTFMCYLAARKVGTLFSNSSTNNEVTTSACNNHKMI